MRFLLLSRQFLLLALLDFSRAAITIITIIGQSEQRTPSRLFGYSKNTSDSFAESLFLIGYKIGRESNVSA